MNKPKLLDYLKVVAVIDGKEIGGIDFATYAFDLEEYIRQLEKQLLEVTKRD